MIHSAPQEPCSYQEHSNNNQNIYPACTLLKFNTANSFTVVVVVIMVTWVGVFVCTNEMHNYIIE